MTEDARQPNSVRGALTDSQQRPSENLPAPPASSDSGSSNSADYRTVKSADEPTAVPRALPDEGAGTPGSGTPGGGTGKSGRTLLPIIAHHGVLTAEQRDSLPDPDSDGQRVLCSRPSTCLPHLTPLRSVPSPSLRHTHRGEGKERAKKRLIPVWSNRSMSNHKANEGSAQKETARGYAEGTDFGLRPTFVEIATTRTPVRPHVAISSSSLLLLPAISVSCAEEPVLGPPPDLCALLQWNVLTWRPTMLVADVRSTSLDSPLALAPSFLGVVRFLAASYMPKRCGEPRLSTCRFLPTVAGLSRGIEGVM